MSAPVVTFKKGPSRRPIQSRKRSASPTVDPVDPSSSSSSSVIRPEKKSLLNPLIQGTKRRRDTTEDDYVGGLDELDYKADSESGVRRADELATRDADWDLRGEAEEQKAAAAALREKRVKLNEDGDIDDGLYHGSSNYLKTINKTREVLDKKMQAGPIRATANIRSITLVDYQPDVCKDYKETGFCGYGDSCKFLHDRGDYLAGWQMDNNFSAAGGQQVMQEEDEEEEVPFACLICREPFKEPVVTKCGHYFCMKCAIDRFIKSPKCYACGAPTSGIFNKAEKILAKMEARNQAKRDAKGIVDDEAQGDDDEDGGIEFGGVGDDEEEGEGSDIE